VKLNNTNRIVIVDTDHVNFIGDFVSNASPHRKRIPNV